MTTLPTNRHYEMRMPSLRDILLCQRGERVFAILRDLALIDSGEEKPGELARLHDAARAIVVEVER